MNRYLGIAIMGFLSFTMTFSVSQAGQLTGAEGKALQKAILAAGPGQVNYDQFVLYETSVAAQGYVLETSQPDLSIELADPDQKAQAEVLVKFELRRNYQGQHVPTPKGDIYRAPTIDLNGQLWMNCEADFTNCSFKPSSILFTSFEVRWSDLPPVGGSSSSSGGRD